MERHTSRISLSVLAGVFVAVALGWFAAKLNAAGVAPIGLLSLAVGIALGAATGRLAIAVGITCRKRVLLATVVLTILTILAEHAWLYREFCRQWREAWASQAKIAMFRPEAPWSAAKYFAQEATPSRIALWCVDAVLIVTGAITTALVTRGYLIGRTVFPNPDL
jgi:hypothetical protein